MGAGAAALKAKFPPRTKELNEDAVRAVFGEYYDPGLFATHSHVVKGAEELSIERSTLERILDDAADSSLDPALGPRDAAATEDDHRGRHEDEIPRSSNAPDDPTLLALQGHGGGVSSITTLRLPETGEVLICSASGDGTLGASVFTAATTGAAT